MKHILSIILMLMVGITSFGQRTLTVQVTPKGTGTVNVASTSTHASGGKVTLTATPATDCTFLYWREGTATVSTSQSFTYTMPDRDVTMTAHFKYSPDNPNDPDSQTYLGKVATPSISVSSETLTINCATAGATIYYTLDGKAPTTASTVYTKGVKLTQNGIVKAMATHANMDNSAVASYEVNTFTAATPTFSQSGDKLTISCSTAGATIYYTLDGSEPTASSTKYTAPITLTPSYTIKAIAVKENMNNSAIVQYTLIDGHEYVNLGLPSGLLWATCNVGASKPEDYGNYYAWGETNTKANYSESSSTTYLKTIDQLKSASIIDSEDNLTAAYDAASRAWGGTWRMPTNDEIEELRTYCTTTWTSQGGVYGIIITGPNGNSIFLPAAGHYDGTTLKNGPSSDAPTGYYWTASATANSHSHSRRMAFNRDGYIALGNNTRYTGRLVRPVNGQQQLVVPTCATPTFSQTGDKLTITCTTAGSTIYYTIGGANPTNASTKYTSQITITDNCTVKAIAYADGFTPSAIATIYTTNSMVDGHEYVNLGLPSGLLWATCNVGASKPEDYGNYYAWGETNTKGDYSESSSTTYFKTIDQLKTASIIDSEDNLTAAYDAASKAWGGTWRMPTNDEIEELRTYCTTTWTSQGGVYGIRITGFNGNSIFLPAAGHYDGTTLKNGPSSDDPTGYYWTASSTANSHSHSRRMAFNRDGNIALGNNTRYTGRLVRPVNWLQQLAMPTCATPTFSQTGDKLTITCATAGASIYYAIGDANPTNTSTKYTGPITITDNRTIKAIAYATNFNVSKLASYTPNSTACQQVAISVSGSTATLTCATSAATIYYTLDGTTPTTSSTKYTAPIILPHNCTIKAIAVKENMNNSTVSSYTVNTFNAATPTFSQNGDKLTISCSTAGATIYYTIGGANPTNASTKYTEPITITDNRTIKAIAYADKFNASAVASYTPNSAACQQVTISVNGSTATLTCATSGATIYYTLDGATPTTYSTKYTAPITLTHNCTIKAMAVKENMNNSAVSSYTVSTFMAATPTFSQNGDKLTISCSTAGATIYYTIGGANPTNASTKYTEPITITDNRTIKAIAYADKFNASAVAIYTPNSAACQQVAISVSGTKATLTCATSGATIYYTLDGTTPTTYSTKYTAPITLTHNCTIKAMAVKENMNNSAVSSYTVSTFNAATPTFSQNGDKLTISCSTAGATIYYTIGGTNPTNASTKYTSPITITDNRIVKAIAYAPNFNASSIASYTPNSAACQQVAISVSGTKATLTCATSGATIYYTLDGSTPTTSSSKYTTPITLTHNCTIKAIAVKENMNNSTVSSYTVSTFMAATPTFSQNDDKLTISCSTAGATIYYTIGGANPTNASTKYTGPITITDNRTIKAIAYATNFNASAVAIYTPNSAACQQVTISVSGSIATLTCGTNGATIYYTLDGTTPKTSSTKYTAPITLTHNCTIKAIAVKENMNNSALSSYTVSTFNAATPTFSQNGDKLTISCSTAGATIYYTIGGANPTNASTKYTGPITISDNRTIKAIAYADNFNASTVASYTPNSAACQPVTISVSRTKATLTCATTGATIYYTLDGTMPTTSSTKYTAPITLTHNCSIKAIAVKENLNNSEVTSYTISIFACEDVEMNYNGRYVTLASATQDAIIHYTTDGSEPTGVSAVYTEPFDAKGLRTVKAVAMKENWNDSNTMSEALPCYSNGRTVWVAEAEKLSMALKVCGTDSLTAIVWIPNETIGESALAGINNPNLLLYVNMRIYAPSSVKNIVVSGQAENIVLQDGADFFCPQEFTARNISYTHRYTMQTPMDGRAAGWETIALPFDVQSITHETNGTMAPFAANDPTAKPFWLCNMTASGFKRAASIEANTPYIICMPNNEEYADDYILAGEVTFSSQNAVVPVTETKVSKYRELMFVPTTTAVDKGRHIFTLNREGDVPGSMFVNESRAVNPFEAYITLGNISNAVKAFSISSLMDDMTDDIPTIAATRNEDNNVYSISGSLVNTAKQTKGLAKGLYIIGKKRVMVK